MNAEPSFVDTNVFVYVFDDDSPRKQETARIESTLDADATVLLTEDLQHGQMFGRLRVLNPFRDDFAG